MSPTSFRLTALALLLLTPPAFADTPLHRRVDEHLAAARPDFKALAAPASQDAEFLRRVYLDLTGTIPPAAEARAFLADKAPGKRAQLIDRLLASPEHARHLATVFDVLLMERRPDKHVQRGPWQDYLRASFAANKPYDVLVREILSADGSDPKTRAAAKFFLDREGEPHLLTRDLSRLFLGMNFQCAQCHDHPHVDAYKQEMYYGLFAFLNRSFVFTGKDKVAVYAEKAEGDATFQSVFDPAKVTKSTGPRLLQAALVQEPKLEKGKEYEVAPAKDVRPVPKFSRRARLPDLMVGADNVAFRRNVVNRVWAMLLGRGLVHPVDYDHEANPASHPELLTLLADDFAARKYDLRYLLRELTLSQAYQRSSEMPADGKEVPPESFAAAALKPLGPEPLARALMQATGLTDAERKALGKDLTEEKLHARLAGNIAPLVATFGGAAGQPEGQSFQATLDQALFLTNGNTIRGWLAPKSGNLTDRLASLPDPGAVAEELYLSVLTRLPTEGEKKDVAEYLKGRTDRPAAFQEMAWALLASAEFRFNH